MGREFGFPFFGEITEAVPGNLGAGNRAAESDLFLISSYDQPVTFARAVLYMYFLSRNKGVSFEEKDFFVHYFSLIRGVLLRGKRMPPRQGAQQRR